MRLARDKGKRIKWGRGDESKGGGRTALRRVKGWEGSAAVVVGVIDILTVDGLKGVTTLIHAAGGPR